MTRGEKKDKMTRCKRPVTAAPRHIQPDADSVVFVSLFWPVSDNHKRTVAILVRRSVSSTSFVLTRHSLHGQDGADKTQRSAWYLLLSVFPSWLGVIVSRRGKRSAAPKLFVKGDRYHSPRLPKKIVTFGFHETSIDGPRPNLQAIKTTASVCDGQPAVSRK